MILPPAHSFAAKTSQTSSRTSSRTSPSSSQEPHRELHREPSRVLSSTSSRTSSPISSVSLSSPACPERSRRELGRRAEWSAVEGSQISSMNDPTDWWVAALPSISQYGFPSPQSSPGRGGFFISILSLPVDSAFDASSLIPSSSGRRLG